MKYCHLVLIHSWWRNILDSTDVADECHRNYRNVVLLKVHSKNTHITYSHFKDRKGNLRIKDVDNSY